jgi:hypothetical protein
MYITKVTMRSCHWQFHHTPIPSPAAVFHHKSLDGTVCNLHSKSHTNMKHKACGALDSTVGTMYEDLVSVSMLLVIYTIIYADNIHAHFQRVVMTDLPHRIALK